MQATALDVLSKCESLAGIFEKLKQAIQLLNERFYSVFIIFINTLFQLSNIKLKEENDTGKEAPSLFS